LEQATVERLRELNRTFYREVAGDFSRSRRRLQPGMERVLDGLVSPRRVLDLGCGDGRFGVALRRRHPGAEYLGVEECAPLMSQRADAPRMLRHDLLEMPWPSDLSKPPFDVVVCYSVLHHIPAAPLRLRFLQELHRCLEEGGRWAISVWQILHRERFRRRRVDWSEVGLDPADLEGGDLLVDWRGGGRSLRYVHHFEEAELRDLVVEAGLVVEDSWRSDGDSGDLGLYLVGR
jgi:SAM-dependent methyltransferase